MLNLSLIMLKLIRLLNSAPLFLLSAIGLATLIGAMLSPANELPDITLFPYADKFFHFIAFGLVALALLFDVGRYKKAYVNLRLWFTSGSCLSILGAIIEYAQLYIEQGRSAEGWDIIANALGAYMLPLLFLPIVNKCLDLFLFDIKQWSSDKKELDFVKQLYFVSFPENERRPWNDFESRISDKSNKMKLHIVYVNNKPAGFISWWHLDASLRYIEHFAIDAQLRNRGIGYKALFIFRSLYNDDIVLETEPAELSEMSKHRRGFYTRCGFYVHDEFRYIQPAYAVGLEPVHLNLVTSKRDVDLLKVTRLLHKIVYGEDKDLQTI